MKVIFAICFLGCQSVFASEFLSKLVISDSKGDTAKISLLSSTNQYGRKEVKILADGFPRLFKKLNPIIGYGRDLDGNGKIDTWFFITQRGVETIQKEGTDELGRDILSELILSRYQSNTKLYLTTAASTLLSYLFISADEIQSEQKNFYLDWIALEELSIRLENEKKKPQYLMSQTQYEAQVELMFKGYEELSTRLEKFKEKDLFGYVALDVGLWASGGIVMKWGGKLLSVPIRYLSETSLYKYLSENIAKYFSMHKEFLSKKLEALKLKSASPGLVLSTQLIRTRIYHSLQSMVIKQNLLTKVGGFIHGVGVEWKYIALNVGIQTAAEAASHYDDIKDPNPLILASNLLSRPDVQQDIGFMTADTILMTGMSRSLTTFKARYAACGLIALNDSSVINFVIKKDDNYKRIAMDTTWEMIVGNAQVQADLAALTYFEKLALKKKNPKLKLIGYAIALIDQGVGYYAYAKAAEKLDTPAKPQPMLVPILVQE